MLSEAQVDRLLDLGERLVKLAETVLTPVYEVPKDAEVWKLGDPRKAETKADYRNLPDDGRGRFQELVAAGRPK